MKGLKSRLDNLKRRTTVSTMIGHGVQHKMTQMEDEWIQEISKEAEQWETEKKAGHKWDQVPNR